VGALALCGHLYGWANLFLYYSVPLFVFASWLTVVTFLHHHEGDVELPWFGDKVCALILCVSKHECRKSY
jgi:hypothetical protein